MMTVKVLKTKATSAPRSLVMLIFASVLLSNLSTLTSVQADDVPLYDAITGELVVQEEEEEVIDESTLPECGSPIFDPPSGNFTLEASVGIRSLTPGAVVYYTLDGTTPQVYSQTLPDGENIELKSVCDRHIVCTCC